MSNLRKYKKALTEAQERQTLKDSYITNNRKPVFKANGAKEPSINAKQHSINAPTEFTHSIQVDNKIANQLKHFINFIEFHSLSSNDIWEDKSHLTLNQFSDRVYHKTGYQLNTGELVAISKLNATAPFLLPENFHVAGLWVSNWQKSVSLIRYRPTTSRPLSAAETQLSRRTTIKKSNVLVENSRNTQNSNSGRQRTEVSPAERKSLMQKSRARRFSKENQLRGTIRGTILQKKWDFLVMASQLNRWANENETATQPCPKYCVKNLPEGVLIIRTYQGDQDIVSDTVFRRIYHKFKTSLKKQKNKISLKSTLLILLQESVMKKQKNWNPVQKRDNELSYVLLRIARMKDLFSHQDHLLQKAQVNQ